MYGWKPAERMIDTPVLLDRAVELVEQEGFEVQVRNPGYALLRRDGTQFTARGERLPLELALAEGDTGMFLQLRYDGFVLFDTGDLQQLADDLAEVVRDGA